MAIEILFIWIAFILGYFAEHLKNVYATLRPNFFSWRRWWAVMKGTFTKRTAVPLTVMLLLTLAIILLHIGETNDLKEAENQRTDDLIQAVNQTINDSLKQDNAELIEAINNQTDAILKAIQQSGGQNGE